MRCAVIEVVGSDYAEIDAQVTRSERGDLQCNVAMGLARRVGEKSRPLAERIVAALPANDLVERIEIAGPGFLNITLRDRWLSAAISQCHADPRLGVPLAASPERVVIDYSSPNVAKELHVGHLRSTNIGDCLARVLSWRGHVVIRQNHIGDWGTPFGMLIEQLVDVGEAEAQRALAVGELTTFYRTARKRFDDEPGFADRARARVVLLQAGDPQTRAWWRSLLDQSLRYMQEIYRALNVTLVPEDVRAESFYNDRLAPLADELEASGQATISDGASCVFVPGFTNREGGPLPIIVRKRGGGFGYAATDLAAIRYRFVELGATRALYVVGSPQIQHLAMIHAAAHQLGWVQPPARAEHVAFGSVLGPDGLMLKSRDGYSVRLIDLIHEAIERADTQFGVLLARRTEQGREGPELSPEQRREVARMVGIGAIKYADLSSDRIKDYIYDPARMVRFEGDTAGYLQYVHARVRGVFRKASAIAEGTVSIAAPTEHVLALRLLGFGSAVAEVERTLEPHRLAGYLYDLATAFTKFYDACPILTAEPAVRGSRLVLADLVGRTIQQGLDLLGIEVPDVM